MLYLKDIFVLFKDSFVIFYQNYITIYTCELLLIKRKKTNPFKYFLMFGLTLNKLCLEGFLFL